MNKRRKSWLLATCLIFCAAALLWFGAKIYIEYTFPMSPSMTENQAIATWSKRGQFGSMFGALTCALTAITIAFAVYSTYQEARELDRQNESRMWATNYEYLREAKRMVAEHEEILELHGLPPGICKTLGVTPAQVTYVLIDAKAADLYYKMAGGETIKPTLYRTHLLSQPIYRKIMKGIILPGKMLGESQFSRFIEKMIQ